jgi:hypothetical protein
MNQAALLRSQQMACHCSWRKGESIIGLLYLHCGVDSDWKSVGRVRRSSRRMMLDVAEKDRCLR